MASIKNLKKGIKYLINDLVSECEVYRKFHPDADSKKINGIIESIQKKGANIISKLNEKTSSKSKADYKSILDQTKVELLKLVDELPKAGK